MHVQQISAGCLFHTNSNISTKYKIKNKYIHSQFTHACGKMFVKKVESQNSCLNYISNAGGLTALHANVGQSMRRNMADDQYGSNVKDIRVVRNIL